MGKLAQTCEDLAEGRQSKRAWRLLIGDPVNNMTSLIFSESPKAIQNGKLSELELAYRLLATNEASDQATAIHHRLFNLDTGASRLETIRQAVACAYLAACSRHPLSSAAVGDVAKWAPRAMGVSTGVAPDDLNLSMLETTDTIITRALEAVDHDKEDKRLFAQATTRWFADIARSQEHELAISILLYDQRKNTGSVAEIHLTRFGSGIGHIYPSPHTKLQVEVNGDTRDGIEAAWRRVCNEIGRTDVDVQWELSRTNSISGRSAEAAFSIGLKLLLLGAPYSRQCIVSAMVDDDGKLNHVGGINEAGNPKLKAATSLVHGRSSITVITSPANRLSAPEEGAWRVKGVEVTTCEHVDDALRIASRQLEQLENLLTSQIKLICDQASQRFGRRFDSLEEFADCVVPMRVAQGIRPESGFEEGAAKAKQQQEELDEDQEQQAIDWDDFRADFRGQAIVLGDPGFGKTTLLLQAAAEQCQKARAQLKQGKPVPDLELAFFLPAAQLDAIESTGPTAAALLTAIDSFSNIDSDLRELASEKIANGQCLLCIDALDEVTDRKTVEGFLTRLTREHPKTRILLSSRLTGYLGSPVDIQNDNHVELKPFTLDQMRAAVETWFDNTEQTEQVWKSVSGGRLHDVLRSPILLNFARQQVADCIKSGAPIPNWQRRTELYDGFIKLAFTKHRERTNQRFEEMEQDEFRVFLPELARALWLDSPRQSVVHRAKFNRLMKQVINECDLWALKGRFRTMWADLQDCGILVPVNASGADSSMMFLHRTIGEYLAGKCIARRIVESDSEAWPLLEKKCWDPDWRQVILFCAGSLGDPQPLLSRLKNDEKTGDNPLGDDLLRHRLLLAAQCLPELATRDDDIVQNIAEQVMRSYGMKPIHDTAVDAIKSLIAVNAKYRGQPIAMRLRMETCAPCLTPSAYSDQLFDRLLGLLWKACEYDGRRTHNTRRSPAPYARAIVAICDSLDIDQLRRSDSDDPEHFWRVVGAVFREFAKEPSKPIFLNAEFLRFLGACWFDPALNLDRVVWCFPAVSAELLEQSSVLTECCRILADVNAGELHHRALSLLNRIGDVAGTQPGVMESLASLQFSVSRRDVEYAITAMQRSLANERFIGLLESRIYEVGEEKRQLGIKMFLSLNAHEMQPWRDGLERILKQGGKSTDLAFRDHFKSNPSIGLVKVVDKLLREPSLPREIGMRAVRQFAYVTESGRFSDSATDRLDCLDELTPALVGNNDAIAFDKPANLEHLARADDPGMRRLFPLIFRIACRYRSSDQLVSWGVDQLARDAFRLRLQCPELYEQNEIIASAFDALDPDQIEYLRETVLGSAIEKTVVQHLSIAKLIYEDAARLAGRIRSSSESWDRKLGVMAELPHGTVADFDLLDMLLAHLDERSRKKHLFSRAVQAVHVSLITPEIAERFVRLFYGRNSREFVGPISGLASQCPEAFVPSLAKAYSDKDCRGHEDVGEVLPVLGNHLVDSKLFSVVVGDLSSSDRRVKRCALRILSRLLHYCDEAFRDRIISVASQACYSSADLRAGGNLLASGESDQHFVRWLIGQLNHDDVAIARFAARLLNDGVYGVGPPTERCHLIAKYDVTTLPKFPFKMEARSDGHLESLARSTSETLRWFRLDAETGFGLTIKHASN
jgi:hypothetical protein